MTEIRNLSFSYKKKEPLYSSLSLSLEQGSIYGLLGKNGAGKTTLLRIICGLLFAKEGTCTVSGLPSRKRLPAMLEEIYFLPEEFGVPAVTPRVYRKLYGPLYPRFDDTTFSNCLREFEIGDDKALTRMSYGQKKKFLVAFGLATDCRLLLLDEPTNGLDIPSKRQFRKLVASATSDHRTFLISTHQVRDMENLIDPIIILDQGHIIFQQDAFSVSERLTVTAQNHEPAAGEALYSEKVPGGYSVIRERSADEEASRIELELLFNAVVSAPGSLDRIFETGR